MCGRVAKCTIVTWDVVIFMWDETVNRDLLAHHEICNPLGLMGTIWLKANIFFKLCKRMVQISCCTTNMQ